MRIYQQEYGLTELRLYTTAFMGWLALVFVWFSLTVLRGNRKPFAFGALVTGFLLIASLLGLNPDALIARTNTAHALGGHKLDSAYVLGLSADAVPELARALPGLGPQAFNNPGERCDLSNKILQWAAPGEADWRTWSVGRARAIRAAKENESSLRAIVCAKKDK